MSTARSVAIAPAGEPFAATGDNVARMRNNRIRFLLPPLLVWTAGMVLAFGPILFSGLNQTFAGLGDVRLVNFTLEHSYRWAAGYPIHADFWSPPIYYPHQNVAAYTDLLVGAAGPYWVARAAGANPGTAYLLWVFFNWTLNYLVAYLLFRRLLGVEPLGAGAGAFLFAFGSPRLANVVHQQLQPAYYLLLALAAVVVLFREQEVSLTARRVWVAVFSAALVLQAYTAFYPLYFFCLCLLVAALLSLAMPAYRRRMTDVLRRDWQGLGAAGVASFAALVPLASRYLRAADEVGLRGYEGVTLPLPPSWFLMGRWNSLYGWLQLRDGPFFDIRDPHQSNGVGPLTTVLALVGLYQAWKNRSVRLLALTVGILIVFTTMYPGGYSGWRLIYELLPGAAALRSAARIGMIALLPLSLGVAVFFSSLRRKGRWLLILVLGVAMVAEQSHQLRLRDRSTLDAYVAGLADQLQPDCAAFLLALRGRRNYGFVHDDAAWITLATGIPTLNGRYGNVPPDWPLLDVRITNPEDRRAVEVAMADWIARNGLPAERVCWIETRGLLE